MKRVLFAAAAVWFAAGASGVLSAQAPSGPAAEVQGSYNRLKPNVIKAAEKMPDADYQFKPVADIDVCADCESCDGGAAAYLLGDEWDGVRSEERAKRYGGQGDNCGGAEGVV